MKSYWPRDTLLLVYDQGESVASVTNTAREIGSWLPIVAYKERPNVDLILSALKHGAMSYMDWPLPDNLLKRRIEKFLEEADRIADRAEFNLAAVRKVSCLSPRERQVLDQIISGRSNCQIADDLGLSPRTVEVHRSSLLRKLEVENSLSALKIGLEAKTPWSRFSAAALG